MNHFLFTVFVLLITLLPYTSFAQSDTSTPFLPELEPITVDNAEQLTEISVLGRGTIETLAWSPDGMTLAVGGSLGIWLYDAESLTTQPHLIEEMNGAIEHVAFTADSSALIASNENAVRLWDVMTGSMVSQIVGYPDPVYHVAVNHDGTMLALATWDGIHRREVATGSDVAVWTEDYLQPIDRIAFSPDGRTLALALYNDHTIRLWDVATATEIAALTGHTDRIMDLTFSPDGTVLASSDVSQIVWLWDLTTYSSITSLDTWATSLSFSPDGRMLVTTGTSVILWDIEARSQIINLPMNQRRIKDAAFSPDGRMLAAGDSNTVQIWDTTTASEIELLEGYRDGVRSIAFSPDGVTLASASADGLVQLWDVSTESEVASFRPPYSMAILVFNSDGSLLAGGDIIGTIYLWDIDAKRLINRLNGHPARVAELVFSVDDILLASSGWDDSTVRLWDLEGGEEAVRIETDAGSGIEGLAFSPDGTTLAYSVRDKVHLWDVASQADYDILEWHSSGFGIEKLVFSPDGDTLAIGQFGGVRFWDVTSLTEIGRVATGTVTDMAYSPNGSILAVSADTGVFQFIDVEAQEQILSLRGHSLGSTLPVEEYVWSVSFSPDGMILASSAEDGTIRLWGVPVA
jgi:WD40 repeat protein